MSIELSENGADKLLEVQVSGKLSAADYEAGSGRRKMCKRASARTLTRTSLYSQ